MARWNRPEVPHKGWRYVGIEDLGEGLSPDDEIQYEQCEMCGNEKIRYVHILEHPAYDGEIRAGCVCASKMIDDYAVPLEREHAVKNRLKRKQSFFRQEWYTKSSTGNLVLRYKGEHITIIKSKHGPGYGVIFQNECKWDYRGKKILDLLTAKLVAFDLFDELPGTQY